MILFFLRREKESRASSSRQNQGRINKERKKHDHKTDFLFKFNQGELDCAEVGKEDAGDGGTKEMKELGLKCPKMMKYQLWQLAKTIRQHRMDLVIVEFVMMGNVNRSLIALKGNNIYSISRNINRSQVPCYNIG